MQQQCSNKEQVVTRGTYRHYKGNLYKVLAIARHSEDASVYVVYQGLSDSPEFGPSPIWVRPYNEFIGEVIVEGKSSVRFTFIKSEN